jgi:predicted regulator of Ras-like GTPase activity (Roadblock/LC7/MglB family)
VFRESLQKIVDSCDGALAAVLMGFDGIGVETYVKAAEPDVNTIGMELSFLLGQLRKAAETLELGDLEEITLKMAKATVVLRVVTKEYFLLLAVAPEGNLGKARYLVRITAPQIQQDI